MVGRGDNVGSCVDEESSSSSFRNPRRFPRAPTLMESSLGLYPLGSLGRMPSGRDSLFLHMSMSRFYP